MSSGKRVWQRDTGWRRSSPRRPDTPDQKGAGCLTATLIFCVVIIGAIMALHFLGQPAADLLLHR